MSEWDSMAAFLADPATHGGTKTVRFDTHTAVVVVAGERAWKLRRPVNYGWLDYATRARRRHCAEREIALNSGPAPGLYLGLGGILRDGEIWRLVESGDLPADAEPVVVMRRFRQRDLFDRMAAEGRLTPQLMPGQSAVAERRLRRRRAGEATVNRLVEDRLLGFAETRRRFGKGAEGEVAGE